MTSKVQDLLEQVCDAEITNTLHYQVRTLYSFFVVGFVYARLLLFTVLNYVFVSSGDGRDHSEPSHLNIKLSFVPQTVRVLSAPFPIPTDKHL
jgi:hypothetical protein